MNLNDEKKIFHHAVYSVVEKIPYGHITSYGHIAYLIGKPAHSRHVGTSLKHLFYIVPILNESIAEGETPYDLENLPWWRVVSGTGNISPRESGHEHIQAEKLKSEGIEVSKLKVKDEDKWWLPDDVDI